METKGKRRGRSAASFENPVPQAVPAETPMQIQPREMAGPSPAMVPSQAEVVEQRIPSALPATSAPRGQPAGFGSGAFAAIDESRAAMARGFDALSEELAGLARCSIDTTARTAIEMLAVKTLSDAIAVNASFARTSFDNWLGGSAKFSELGVKLAVESSRPFFAHLAKSWSLAPRPGG